MRFHLWFLLRFSSFLFFSFLHFEHTVLICRSYSIFPASCLLSFLDLGLVSVINFGKVSAGTASTITCVHLHQSSCRCLHSWRIFSKDTEWKMSIFPLSIIEMLCHFLLASSVSHGKFCIPSWHSLSIGNIFISPVVFIIWILCLCQKLDLPLSRYQCIFLFALRTVRLAHANTLLTDNLKV